MLFFGHRTWRHVGDLWEAMPHVPGICKTERAWRASTWALALRHVIACPCHVTLLICIVRCFQAPYKRPWPFPETLHVLKAYQPRIFRYSGFSGYPRCSAKFTAASCPACYRWWCLREMSETRSIGVGHTISAATSAEWCGKSWDFDVKPYHSRCKRACDMLFSCVIWNCMCRLWELWK